MNNNNVFTSGSATNNAILSYVTSQNIQNPPAGSGDATISIDRTGGMSSIGLVSQTSNGNIVR